MNVILGRDAYIEFYQDETWQAFVCCESVEISFTTETKSVKTIGDGIWSRVRGQKNSYSVTLSGIVPYDGDVNAFYLMENQWSMVEIPFRMIFKQNDGTEYTQIRGTGLVTGTTLGAPVDFLNCSITIQGVGRPELGAVPTCTAEIADYDTTEPTLGFLWTVTINSLVTGTVTRYDWRLNGGVTESSFADEWTVNVRIYGDHVVEVWPVCDNGVQGVKTTINISATL